MRVLDISNRFVNELNFILDFIKERDGLDRAVSFHDAIYTQIDKIPFMPFRFRQNIEANDKNIREMVFKGYKVPFRITADKIEILGIYKTNLWNNQ